MPRRRHVKTRNQRKDLLGSWQVLRMAARDPLPDDADPNDGLLSAAAQLGVADSGVEAGPFAGVTWNPRYAPIILAATKAFLIHVMVVLADHHPKTHRSASSASGETPPPSPEPLQPGTCQPFTRQPAPVGGV